jgi:hypothetical protein
MTEMFIMTLIDNDKSYPIQAHKQMHIYYIKQQAQYQGDSDITTKQLVYNNTMMLADSVTVGYYNLKQGDIITTIINPLPLSTSRFLIFL